MSLSEFIYTVLLKPRLLRSATNAFLKRLIPEKVLVQGASVFLNPTDPVVCGALTLGLYENDEIGFFIREFQPGMTFVDVGANVGLYSALAGVAGAKHILALEPHRETFSFLQKTLAANPCTGSCLAENLAAGSAPGLATLYSNSQNKGDNRIYADPMLDQKEQIQITTLDDLCTARKISSIDFLKIDVQGAESHVLDGAQKILSRSPKCTLLTEFWPRGLGRCGTNPADYLRLLTETGFFITELTSGGIEKEIVPQELINSSRGRKYRNLVGRIRR